MALKIVKYLTDHKYITMTFITKSSVGSLYSPRKTKRAIQAEAIDLHCLINLFPITVWKPEGYEVFWISREC